MRRILYFIPFILLLSCAVTKAPKEEFRGVWIATVANIDWPKHPEDDVEKKKKDFIAILDFYKKLNFNAAIVQVRTAGDALYETDLAPWSKYLSGKEGEAPKGFDHPLKWMIEETHKRGMEFHAWLNPYRASVNLDTTALAKSHDFYQHRDWMVKYGGKYYYNPGIPEVRDKFNQIIKELVSNYEVDAIHFDDYFYPYKVEGEVFEDASSFAEYGLPNQTLEDWRRSNVDSLVSDVHKTIKTNKPWVQFGISPFGVWKNKSTDPRGSDTQAGQTTFEDLYADPLLWVQKGWLDYLAPQVYWSLNFPLASHKKITSWWNQATPNTHLYIGNGVYKIKNNSDEAWNKDNEIPKQLKFSRKLEHVNGNIFFSAKSLMGNHEKVNQKLERKFYQLPAKNPGPLNQVKSNIQSPNIESIKKDNGQLELCVSYSDSVPRFINLYLIKGKQRQLLIKEYFSENNDRHCFLAELASKYANKNLAITIIDAYGNESDMQVLNLKTK
ncbi:glycoside hydrolase family 10 protein [Allomuricauda sp. M10]|uniref:glycoside hydrolase family 10 protein n=1 Tax=Allomuricauda sp. M10 TaxID=2683292 RepID=UPI001D18D551|nr:family 10 glycosylhydrolase [Muricauda sp. M10]